MRTRRQVVVGFLVASIVLGAVALAQAEIVIERFSGLQYNGGRGLFVAILSVETTEQNALDATLLLPNAQVLHPLQSWTARRHVFFKFATAGKPVTADGQEIHAVVMDPDGTSDPADATATCTPLGTLFFVCR